MRFNIVIQTIHKIWKKLAFMNLTKYFLSYLDFITYSLHNNKLLLKAKVSLKLGV